MSREVEKIRLRAIKHFKYKLLEQENKIHPKFTCKDVTDEERFSRLGNEDDNLVAFNIKPRLGPRQPEKQRKQRLFNRYSRFPRVDMMAHSVLDGKLFPRMINICVVLSVVQLFLDADIHEENEHSSQENLHKGLQIMKWCILCVLLLEILLKWLDDFGKFWESKWNIFDLIITVLTAVPEIMPKTASKSRSWLKLLIQFRALRFFKILAKFPEMRFILMSIYRVVQGKPFRQRLLILLSVFYIFATLGVKIFAKHTTSTVSGLLYQSDFKDVLNALLTLFSIYTMDHCMDLIEDIRKVPELDFYACFVFIVVWFFIGALTLSSIVVDAIVDSFHQARSDLTKEVKQKKMRKKAEEIQQQVLHVEEPSTRSENTELKWEKLWNEYFQTMEYHDNDASIWHEDTLFRFFRLQERLQRNLEMQAKLQDIADQAILNMHDS